MVSLYTYIYIYIHIYGIYGIYIYMYIFDKYHIICIWVNYNVLTILPSPGIMVFYREIIPKTAFFQVGELLTFTHIYIYIYAIYIYIRYMRDTVF